MKIKLKDVFSELRISQLFGLTRFAEAHPSYYKYGVHPGIDYIYNIYNNYKDSLIGAAHSGIIVKDDNIDDSGAGINVSIFDPEQQIATRYYHLKENSVCIGDRIIARDIIGIMGTTGLSSGDHLHFELLRTDENGYVINLDNGAGGAINPLDCNVVDWVD